jgi:NADPH-dependent 2,4-dienoyl-CoA reductase/sulfur reductase-like enzyme
MPYYIGDVATSNELSKYIVRPPEVFRDGHDIDIHLNHEVLSLDTKGKEVLVSDAQRDQTISVPYDRLILATGARSRRLNIPGDDAPNVFYLKELSDAEDIKRFIDEKKPSRVVTLGAGFIGLEMAEAFGHLGIKNTILYRGAKPMGRLGDEISEMIIEEVEEKGVRFIQDATASSFSLYAEGMVISVVTDKGEFPTDMVLISVGVVPNTEIAKEAGLALGKSGALSVDERQLTSDAHIYGAGDCCEVIHRITGEPVYVPLGDLANKQGWVAGENAAGGDITYPGIFGSAHFKVFDLEVGFTGLSCMEAEVEGIDFISRTIEGRSKPRLYPGSSLIRVCLVAEKWTKKLLGAQIAGRDGAAHRINILAAALAGGLTIDDVVDLDLAYAPPFTPTIDPILTAARVLMKDMD